MGRDADRPGVLSVGTGLRGAGPNHFDIYAPSGDWGAAPKLRESAKFETCGISPQNMSKMFASIYGSEHLPERLQDGEELRLLRIRGPTSILPPSRLSRRGR